MGGSGGLSTLSSCSDAPAYGMQPSLKQENELDNTQTQTQCTVFGGGELHFQECLDHLSHQQGPFFEESLAEAGFSQEYLEIMAAQRAAALPRPLCPELTRWRTIALTVTGDVLGLFKCPEKKVWFQVAFDLDRLLVAWDAAGEPVEEQCRRLPAACVALLRMALKVETACGFCTGWTKPLLCSVAQALQRTCKSRGMEVPEEVKLGLTLGAIDDEERRAMIALKGRGLLPNLEVWVDVIMNRLTIVSRDVLRHLMPAYRSTISTVLFGLAIHRPDINAYPPRQLAAGVIAFVLAKFQLFPAQVLRPADVDKADWTEIAERICPVTSKAQDPLSESQFMYLFMLLVSTGLTASELSEASALALRLLLQCSEQQVLPA